MTSFSKASSIRSSVDKPLENSTAHCAGPLEAPLVGGRLGAAVTPSGSASTTSLAIHDGSWRQNGRPAMRLRTPEPTPAPFYWTQAIEHGFAQLPAVRRSQVTTYLERARTLTYRNPFGLLAPPKAQGVAAWIRENEFAADGCGIVQVRYGRSLHYNPFTAASQAEICYGNLFSEDMRQRTLSMQNLMRLVKYFEDTCVERDRFVTWYYYFPYQDLRRAWNSCLSQCSIIDVLLKYHEITGAPEYRELALRAYSALLVDVADGGLASIDCKGNHWLQEYSSSRHFPDVLNGLISSVLMILINRPYLGEVVRDEQVAAWLATVRLAIATYTQKWHVDYARDRGRTPVDYYPQMIAQLEVLARHDPNDVYRKYADRWRWIYERASRRRRLLAPFLHVRRRFRHWRYDA